jgi:hypothetical protein
MHVVNVVDHRLPKPNLCSLHLYIKKSWPAGRVPYSVRLTLNAESTSKPNTKVLQDSSSASQNKSRSLDQKKGESDLLTHFRSFELFDLKRAEMSLSLLSCFYKLSKKCYRTCNRPRRGRRSAIGGGRSPLRYLDFDPGSIRTLN